MTQIHSNPFNIYNDPSWQPLLELAREKSDSIVNIYPRIINGPVNPVDELTESTSEEIDGSLFKTTTINAPGRKLVSRSRIDKDVNTTWILEHFLKDTDDLKAYLELPEPEFGGEINTETFLEQEKDLEGKGIAMINTGDPICSAASLFDMAEYTIIAMTEQELFTKLLDRLAKVLLPRAEAVAKALPERLWRVVGSEYASEPYLPPKLYHEYVTKYTGKIIASAKKYGGYPRIHSHGNLKNILTEIKAMGCTGLDPIEPEPQGDVTLKEARAALGEDITLFGNIEASDIENLPTDQFAEKVKTALAEGPNKDGSHFVLMPSACPYGRKLPALAMKNYEKMVELAEKS
jgi:hypothetical protein